MYIQPFIISVYSVSHRHAIWQFVAEILYVIEKEKEAALPDILWKKFLLKRLINPTFAMNNVVISLCSILNNEKR